VPQRRKPEEQPMTKRRATTTLARAQQRAATDSDFRAQVLADDRATQARCQLSDVDWHTLVGTVTALEQQLQRDPLAATEVDHGEADAAGAKD
jgi:hypothetical protein